MEGVGSFAAARSLDPSQLLSQRLLTAPADIPWQELATPAEVHDLRVLEDQLAYLKALGAAAQAKILLAQKAYALYANYPLLARYLAGTCSSGLYEAKLAREEFPQGEIHVYKPAYAVGEMAELQEFAHHLVFNSLLELERYWPELAACQRRRGGLPSLGLRINPEYSEVETTLYNPSAAHSRLGLTRAELDREVAAKPELWQYVEGLHFHTLCEQGAEALEHTCAVVEQKFAPYLKKGLRWLNLGGGHWLSKRDYNSGLLVQLCLRLRRAYGLEIYLEPGEGIALDTAWLLTTVLETLSNGLPIAILDTSAACHMPDVLEMPYQPRVFLLREDGSHELARPWAEVAAAAEFTQTEFSTQLLRQRLAGPTCLAGDIMGDYGFSRALQRGDRLVFCDMGIYSHVKRNSFNGMPLPSLHSWDGCQLKLLASFDYNTFKQRLGNK